MTTHHQEKVSAPMGHSARLCSPYIGVRLPMRSMVEPGVNGMNMPPRKASRAMSGPTTCMALSEGRR